jgi:hypothetical protein
MITMDALEHLSQYRHVDRVDDSVVDAALETLAAAVAADRPPGASRSSPGSARRLRRGRRIVIGASVLAVMAAGSGIAAAAGVFNPLTPTPRAPVIPPVYILELSLPGPEGTTFQVLSLNVTTAQASDACLDPVLTIGGPGGQPAATFSRGHASCGHLVAPAGSTVPPQPQQITPSVALEKWRAPSGEAYDLIYGQSIAGAAQVTLANSDGQIGASEPANANGYVVYMPSAKFDDYRRIVFTDKSGKVLYSQLINP